MSTVLWTIFILAFILFISRMMTVGELEDYTTFSWGLIIGFWCRPTLDRLWMKLNQKFDEWANIS